MTTPLLPNPQNWPVVTLEENPIGIIVEIGTGSTPSTTDAACWGGTYPWLTPKEVTSGQVRKYASSTERTLTEKGLQQAGGFVEPRAVLLTKRAPVGEVVINTIPMAINQGFLSFRCGKGLHPEFLYYWLLANRPYLDAVANGSTYSELYPGDLFEFELALPPLTEQKAIAYILGKLDYKIELNRKLNDSLEAIARAIFKSWFMDFDPVRAKAEGCQPLGMNAETAALFPDSFEDSELGKIPKGWRVESVRNVCSIITRGATPKYQEGSGRFIINQRVNRGFDLDWSALKELHHDLEVPSEKYAHKWDVLVNCLGEGTLGRIHLFLDESSVFAVDQHMTICRPLNAAMGVYLNRILSSPDGQAKIESLKTGSTGMTMFNITKLRNFDFLCPPSNLLDTCYQKTEPIYTKISLNRKESRSLSTIRNVLLPKLLSGEMRIKNAENFIEGVV